MYSYTPDTAEKIFRKYASNITPQEDTASTVSQGNAEL